jgi:translin
MLEDTLRRATLELQRREKARDEVLNRARRIRMLSKQGILLAHTAQVERARGNLAEARRLLTESQPYVEEFRELGFYEEVEASLEEYAEAGIFLSLLSEGGFPEPEELGVTLFSYLLGLGDVPGELKREALDALRRGDLALAERHLERMEEIYVHLVGVEETSLLLKGLRRKMDIARGVIESTRGEVTQEAGRRRLAEELQRLKP